MIYRLRFSLSQFIVLCLLFLASMNAFAKYFYFIIIMFGVFIILNGRKLKVDITLMLLLLFSVIYILFYPKVQTDFFVMMKQFAYPICYFIGLNFLNVIDMKDENCLQNKICMAIIIVSMGAYFHYVLNFIINFGSVFRNNIDIWSGEYLNATGQSALSIMAVAVFVTSVFMAKNLMGRFLSIIGLMSILAYNLILAGRSLIIITAVAIVIGVIYFIINRDVKRKIYKIFYVVALFGFLIYSYIYNFMGIRTVVLDSNLSSRFDTMFFWEDIRMSRKIQYLSKMFEYPFGGGELNEVIGGYAHDLFLDIYSDAGIFALILIVAVIGIGIRNLFFIFRQKSVSHFLKLLFLCMYVVLLLEFLIEPILAGMPWLFCSYCFYQGLLYSFRCFSEINLRILSR